MNLPPSTITKLAGFAFTTLALDQVTASFSLQLTSGIIVADVCNSIVSP